jgi:hypothetical protein
MYHSEFVSRTEDGWYIAEDVGINCVEPSSSATIALVDMDNWILVRGSYIYSITQP